jgi:dipeptidyl aminopeptidase/acylaminoacyl peptidase
VTSRLFERRILSGLVTAGLLGIALWGLVGVALAQPDAGGEGNAALFAQPASLWPQGVISPTSSFVLYHREDDGYIWLLDEASHAPLLAGARPRLSPDGRYIVYQDTIWYGDFYVRDLQTGVDTLVFDAWAVSLGASWAPDGSRLFLDQDCYIYSVEPDGSNLTTVIGAWPASLYCWNDNPDSNPVDGRLAWENEKYGLGVAEVDGQNPYWITNTQPYDYSPRWSPDGQWIAFWRDDNLFRIRPDGSDLTPLTFITAAGDYMDNSGPWTPDGQYIVAAARVNGVKGLYSVASDGSGTLSLIFAREWDDPDWVGSVGYVPTVAPPFRVFLPLVVRK